LGLGSMVCYLSYNIYSENANTWNNLSIKQNKKHVCMFVIHI
jgi:hypothetical protein